MHIRFFVNPLKILYIYNNFVSRSIKLLFIMHKNPTSLLYKRQKSEKGIVKQELRLYNINKIKYKGSETFAYLSRNGALFVS